MLKKLMKYDFVRLEGVLVFLQLAVLIFALLARGTNAVYNEKVTTLWLVIDKIVSYAFIAVMACAFFATFFFSLSRFHSTVFGRLSYFTHTVPANRGTVFDAKTLTGMAVNVITLLVIGAGLLISLWGPMDVKLLFQRSGNLVLVFCLTAVLETLSLYLSVVLGLVLGHRFNRHKMQYSVLMSFAVYSAVSMAVACGMGVFIALKPEAREIFSASAADLTGKIPPMVQSVMWVGTSCYAVAAPALYLLGRKALNKGVNIE